MLDIQQQIEATKRYLAGLEMARLPPGTTPDIPLSEAWGRIACLPHREIILSVSDGDLVQVEWRVWDGVTYHRSPSLKLSVEMALAANAGGRSEDEVFAGVESQLRNGGFKK